MLITDELHEAKEALADANRKLHELDLENARLAGEIRDLQTALKESDAARRDAENRAQRAAAELQQLRIEMERRLQEKACKVFIWWAKLFFCVQISQGK